MSIREIRETHPSYAVASLSRCTVGGPKRMFGSNTTDHRTVVRLRIAEAEAIYGDDAVLRTFPRKVIAEVDFSAAQFGEFITTMNSVQGIPCTLMAREGQPIEEVPATPNVLERSAKAFEARLKEVNQRAQSLIDAAEKVIEGSALPKAKKKELLRAIEVVSQEVTSNIPFYRDLMGEAVTAVITEGKAEADAWMTATIMRAGLDSLQARTSSRIAELPPSTAEAAEEG